MILPLAASGASVMYCRAFEFPTATSQATLPVFASSATRWASTVAM